MNKTNENKGLSEYVVQMNNVTKIYNNLTAIKDISFSVKKGEIVGFLGPNGAGKTTTMNILTGCLSSTYGKVKIAGNDILHNPEAAKKCIGYLPERPPLYDNMTVKEYLKFVCGLKKIKNYKDQIQNVCDLCQITSYSNKLIGQLSKGYRQRVGIAQSLLGEPDVLILDEPTSGLDPSQIVQTRNLIKSFAKDRTVILSTHILSEIQAICDRIIIINKSKIIADDTEENLIKSTTKNLNYTLRVSCESEKEVLNSLKDLADKLFITKITTTCKDIIELEITPLIDDDIALDISNALMKNEIPILYFKDNATTLEQVFLNLIENSESIAVNW